MNTERLQELMHNDLEKIIAPTEPVSDPVAEPETTETTTAAAHATVEATRADKERRRVDDAVTTEQDTEEDVTSAEEKADEAMTDAMQNVRDNDTCAEPEAPAEHPGSDLPTASPPAIDTLAQRDPAPYPIDEAHDYDASEDGLVLVWDDSQDAAQPVVTLARSAEDPSVTDVLMDDEIVAQVPSDAGMTVENITLVRLSSARTLGWAAA